MDDLLGEDWQKPAKSVPSNNTPSTSSTFTSSYNAFRASPALSPSGTASPQGISRPSSTLNGSAKVSGPGDHFGNLLSSKSQKLATNNVTIQERQKQLLEEKRRQQEQQTAMWDNLESGRGTPEARGPSPAVSQSAQDGEDDILAAFNRSAPVNKASHFPPPSSGLTSGRSTPARPTLAAIPVVIGDFDDDDDPFGLGNMPKHSNGTPATQPTQEMSDEDDILGDLARPVPERPSRGPIKSVPGQTETPNEFRVTEEVSSSEDHSLAELVDMGFPVDKAKVALAESGGDVQSAVGWLLQQAHEESKQKVRAEAGERRRSPAASSRSPQRRPRRDEGSAPTWMQEDARSNSGVRRQDSRSPANGGHDSTQAAQDYGSKLFKGATSLWKASQKQMAKTMTDFQQERNPSQPKWMQDSSVDSSRSNSQNRQDPPRSRVATRREPDVTDEAAMLDAPREKPQASLRPQSHERHVDPAIRDRSPAAPLPRRPATQPRNVPQAPVMQEKRQTAKLSRQEVEDQSAQAYISPARRKKATQKVEAQPEPVVDLFSPAETTRLKASTAPARSPLATPSPRPTPAASKPKAPPRNIPSVSSASLSASANDRKAGGEAFKRGDYASAHELYTKALSPLPASHPIAIIVHTNRALTGIKTGDAKSAVADADLALSIIGDSQGVGESIELGAGEGSKEMREFFGKALMRKAEALEHLEKWSDAAAAWRAAVEAGVGGVVSLKGKDRCEKAAAPKPALSRPKSAAAPARKPAAAPPAKSLGDSLSRPSLTSATSAEAVKKLRAANAAADKADDEKFALNDQVDARLVAWKGGKADNLRALLQSLDAVLWAEAGWKKVGMSDLVLPNKVKIIYMKAIAKVHPDKIPQTATTEQRMISGAVFSTLNEAWDKFKRDNNL